MASKKKTKKVKAAPKAKKIIKKAVKKVLKTKPVVRAKKTVVRAKKPVVQKTKPTSKPAPVKSIDYSKAITPLGERLVVRLVMKETLTAGGLIIPDTVSQATGFLKAKVLAIGSGTKNKKGYVKPMDVQVGDTVLFSQHSGTKVQFNSEELQIIKESDVMGIVQN
jgi:chaperonin GroES